MSYPYVEAAGTPYELGFQHGRQAAAQAAAFAEYLIATASARDPRHPEGRSRAEVLQAACRFLPLFEEYCPALLEEVHGLAAGADLPFEEALLLQIRGEVSPLLLEEACTTLAVAGPHTADGGVLIGQNSDMAAGLRQYFLVLSLRPKDAPPLLTWTFAGQLGYHGLNRAGVAHFANSLSGGPEPASRPGGLPHYPIKRRLYECRTRAEVVETWRRMPVCSSGNYLCSSADGAIFDIEATPEGFAVLEDGGEGFLAHANHFLSPLFRTEETDRLSVPDSFARQERMAALLRNGRGGLTVTAAKAFLADHAGHPASICRHEESDGRGMSTVAGLVAEPAAGRLHVSWGPPCEGAWTCYTL